MSEVIRVVIADGHQVVKWMHPPQRVFWALMGGAIAAVLLWVGGTESIQALQAGTISMAQPFGFILLLMCLSLILGL